MKQNGNTKLLVLLVIISVAFMIPIISVSATCIMTFADEEEIVLYSVTSYREYNYYIDRSYHKFVVSFTGLYESLLITIQNSDGLYNIYSIDPGMTSKLIVKSDITYMKVEPEYQATGTFYMTVKGIKYNRWAIYTPLLIAYIAIAGAIIYKMRKDT